MIAAIGEDRGERSRRPDWWRDALPMLMDRRDEQTVATVLSALESMLEGSVGAPGAGVAVAPDRRRLGLVGGGRRRPVPRGGRHVRPGALGGVVRRHRPGGPAVSGGDPDRTAGAAAANLVRLDRARVLADRLRLEKLVHDADCGTPTVEPLFVGEAIERSRSIDAQCVLSLSVEAARVLGLPDPWSLEHLWDIAREPPEDPVRCRAHERVPQLFVAVGRALLARGDLADALALVEERAERASYKRGVDAGDADEAAEAGIATLEIARAARLGRYGPRALREATNVQGRGYAAALALVALTLPPEDYPVRPPQDRRDRVAWGLAWPKPEPPREAADWFPHGRPTTFSIETSVLERLYRETGRENTEDPNDVISLFEDLTRRGRSDQPVLEPLHVTLAVRFGATARSRRRLRPASPPARSSRRASCSRCASRPRRSRCCATPRSCTRRRTTTSAPSAHTRRPPSPSGAWA